MSRFSAYAIEASRGPHVTPAAGVLHAGRFWTTTSRSSLKARSVRAHHIASALVPDEDGATLVGGATAAFDLAHPGEILRDPLGAARWSAAVTRLGLGELGQLVGYLQAARRVPRDWFPDRRALLATRVEQRMRIVGDEVVEADGRWDRPPRPLLRSVADGAARRALELELDPTERRVLTGGESLHVGVMADDGPAVLPARWGERRSIVVPLAACELLHARLPGPACLAAADSTGRRPDEKLGLMLRGTAHVVGIDGSTASLAIDTRRLTSWDGFDASTRRVAAS